MVWNDNKKEKMAAANGRFAASGGAISCDNSAKFCIFAPVPSSSGNPHLPASRFDEARNWYMHEVAEQTWNVRTLQRNISSQYYFRLLKSHNKNKVKGEMEQKTSSYLLDRLEFIKNPVVAEFLGFMPNSDFTESELEKNIISNLQNFMIELGKGFAFVARQQHIRTEKQDYFIDLVFYNYILKCFVLIDLKTTKITHQDVGQMDMYIRMYDELKRTDGGNPTLGIVLCADTDEDIARYSILQGNEQLFASKYKIYLPS
jgi:predicted nuclease of restriction endonuclease-like (RecB) superfamily